MVPELTIPLRRVTFALLLVAAAATEVAAAEERSVAISLAFAALWGGLAAGLGWWLPAPTGWVPPRWVGVALMLLAVAPMAIEPFRRRLFDTGSPLEVQMVFALRNLGLGLAAAAAWPLCLRLACISSLFLILFAISLSTHPAVVALLGIYTAVGCIWLMLTYWSGLEQFFAPPDTGVTVEVGTRREPLPTVALAVTLLLVGCVLGLAAVGPRRATAVLGEWLPTSGGTGGYDPFARGGINDGDDEVQGDNAQSTGLTPSDSFLDSPLPGLYDLQTELYGEPFKPKDSERSIALDGKTPVRETDKPPPDNLRANREFSTNRRRPREPGEAKDRAARAVYEVEGRTPLHLRVVAYDRFDGVAWQEAPFNRTVCMLEKEPGSYWMQARDHAAFESAGPSETHRIKVAQTGGFVVPAPPQLARFRIGRVDRADFFGWGPDRILRLAHREVPSGIAVEAESYPPNPEELMRMPFHTEPGETPRPDIVALARAWAADAAPGWPQVAAIIARLRADYQHDHMARPPEGCRDPLGHFLFTARRGPDYQFATAAALLIRALGYSTRVVNGFYAAPEHYDPATAHTPVMADDLHFWTEVRMPRLDWVVLEPTPGYDVLGPAPSWSERAGQALATAIAWMNRHALILSLVMASATGLWWKRRRVMDTLAVGLWHCFPGRTWQTAVRRAVRLLEWRSGRPRAKSQSPPAWLRAAALDELARMAEWAAYAPSLSPPWPAGEVRAACRRALATLDGRPR